MISETFFSSNYTSIWRSLAPSLEEFVRRANLDGYERHWPPLESASAPERRGIVNEAAFRLFNLTITCPPLKFETIARDQVDQAFASASAYVLRKGDENRATPPTDKEKIESVNLTRRMDDFFRARSSAGLETSPAFEGCGIISACNGDVLIGGSKLYEIKSGERPFRSVDYRQLTVYLALHYAQHKEILSSLHLLNPRTGVEVNVETETFARHSAGQSAATLCQHVVDSFSANLVSE